MQAWHLMAQRSKLRGDEHLVQRRVGRARLDWLCDHGKFVRPSFDGRGCPRKPPIPKRKSARKSGVTGDVARVGMTSGIASKT